MVRKEVQWGKEKSEKRKEVEREIKWEENKRKVKWSGEGKELEKRKKKEK